MGYIPPVKDQQLMVYEQRQESRKPIFAGPSAIERVEFFDALKSHTQRGRYFERHASKQAKRQITYDQEKKLTGKGLLFDQSI